jgi:DNA-binding response OmpR family regulator
MLPLALGGDHRQSQVWFEAGMANSPSSDPQQSGGDRQATVLVVDDDPTLQTMILDYFADNNIQTLLASGREGMLRQLSAQEVSVVILDLRLGLEDGLDALRELRSSFDVPVIIITGHRRDEIDRVVSLELGADDYMTKPFNLRELLARVRAIIRRLDRVRASPAHGARTRQLSVLRLAAPSADPKAYRSERRGRGVDQRGIRAACRLP